jgi:hypothetical protein
MSSVVLPPTVTVTFCKLVGWKPCTPEALTV